MPVPYSRIPPRGKEKMSDTDIEALVGPMIDEARSFIDNEYQEDRNRATDYYFGRPFGDEEPGRSKVVMTVVRDAVRAQLPALLRIFVGPDNIVEFAPNGEEDEETARQKTEYARHVLMEDNAGPMVLHDAFKDALVRRTGFVKWWWDDSEETEHAEYTGLTEEQLDVLLADEEVEVEVLEEYEDPEVTQDRETVTEGVDPETGQPTREVTVEQVVPALFDVKVERTRKRGKVRIEAVPPEEVLWNRTARKFGHDTVIVVHETEKRVDELEAMGYDREDVIEHINTQTDRAQTDIAQRVRQVGEGTSGDTTTRDLRQDVAAPVPYHEVFTRLAIDGKVKLWKLCMVGETHKLLKKVPISHVNMALFCPDPEPHTPVGRSTSDDTEDLQRIQSALARGTLDSMALALDPATVAFEDMVEVKDLLNTERNRVIRTRGPVGDALKEIRHSYVGSDTIPTMEFFDAITESRTGHANKGDIDPSVLQSTTKAAVVAVRSKAQERTAFIAFVFAYTGMRDLMRGILRTIVENQDRARTIRLRNKYVEVDPRAWNADADVIVNIGLGAELVEDKLQVLTGIAEKQEQALQLMGSTPFVSLRHYRNTCARIVELSGVSRRADEFFGEITPEVEQQIGQQMAQRAQQQAGQQGQIEQALAQAEQAKAQIAQAKLQAESALRQRELELRAQEIQLQDDRERDKQAAEFTVRIMEMEAKMGTQLERERIQTLLKLYQTETQQEGEAAKAILEDRRAARPTAGGAE